MKTKQLLKEIKGVFVSPIRRYYLGKIIHGSPYFNPLNFCSSILYIRKLKLKSEEEYQKYIEQYPWRSKYNQEESKYSNLPMVRRANSYIKRIFGNYYFIEAGWPVRIKTTELGWKDKFESPRYEWSPAFQIYFFKWQLCIWWNSPDGDNDQYYEQILWYLNYSDKDIKKAKETWPWTNSDTKQSTWNDKYLL